MMKSLKIRDRFIIGYSFLILCSVPLISNPRMLDGISYFKVCITIILMSVVVPILWSEIQTILSKKVRIIFLLFWVALFVFPHIAINDSYRSVFGAPGRHNGLLSVLNFMYFVLFGIYLSRYLNFLRVLFGIYCISFITSVFTLILTYLNIGKDTYVAALNLSNPDFRENTNMIAPLITIGIISGLLLWGKYPKRIIVPMLLPIVGLGIKTVLLQVPIIILASLVIYISLPLFISRSQLMMIPAAILFFYFVAITILSLMNFQLDSSIEERIHILKFSTQLSKEIELFPRNVDGLSDYTAGFNKGLILDDFHNVFLQVLFSLGLIAFFAFTFLFLSNFRKPILSIEYWRMYLTIYIAIFLSFLFGIVSPNYVYLFAAIVGFGLGKRSAGVVKKLDFPRVTSLIRILIVPLFVILSVFIQAKDLYYRSEISSLTLQRNTSIDFDRNSEIRIVELTKLIPDSGYRFKVASNFYNIGDCATGDSIRMLMQTANPKEIRVGYLQNISKNCWNGN